MFIVFCDSKGHRTAGSDSVICGDGRLGTPRQCEKASEYRNRFKQHYPHKFAAWTHCYFVKKISDISSSNRPLHPLD